ncbi:MAG: hypothetical protein Nkreftii_002284 [Candidatus Nitrospira kreftii]|uniref:HTH HARE-type domain-containing protein n=1 Tax=Candidatus Nitrospira kreftii TaxID=2652173 RepID=A0A7S8FEU0_9BACT|nr:MAG: hypothetical protein Nkreftii_002284 [Candidatus Nitrospira kreftii]
MEDRLAGAIEVLQEKLQEQIRSVLETKKMINSLRQMNGEAPLFNDADLRLEDSGPSRPDQYYGKGPGTACREYLEWRKRACSADEILKGLSQGGFDFKAAGYEDEDSRLRSLSILLAKNTAMFHRLPNGTFGLIAWYPEVAKKKAKEKPNEGDSKKKGDKEEEDTKTEVSG